MAGAPFRIKIPLWWASATGRLTAWVSAKDVILELLRRVDVKGNVGKVFEFFGEGVATSACRISRHHHQHGHRKPAAPPASFRPMT